MRFVLTVGVVAAVVAATAVLVSGGSETGAASSQAGDGAASVDFAVTELAEIDQLRQAFDAAESRQRLVLLVDPIDRRV